MQLVRIYKEIMITFTLLGHQTNSRSSYVLNGLFYLRAFQERQQYTALFSHLQGLLNGD